MAVIDNPFQTCKHVRLEKGIFQAFSDCGNVYRAKQHLVVFLENNFHDEHPKMDLHNQHRVPFSMCLS